MLQKIPFSKSMIIQFCAFDHQRAIQDMLLRDTHAYFTLINSCFCKSNNIIRLIHFEECLAKLFESLSPNWYCNFLQRVAKQMLHFKDHPENGGNPILYYIWSCFQTQNLPGPTTACAIVVVCVVGVLVVQSRGKVCCWVFHGLIIVSCLFRKWLFRGCFLARVLIKFCQQAGSDNIAFTLQHLGGVTAIRTHCT